MTKPEPVSSRTREPKRGDEIFVPSEHPDGHWTNGVVNSVRDGQMLVAALGHRMSNLISVPVSGHAVYWCWPAEVGQKPPGSKSALFRDVEG